MYITGIIVNFNAVLLILLLIFINFNAVLLILCCLNEYHYVHYWYYC